MALEPDENTEQ